MGGDAEFHFRTIYLDAPPIAPSQRPQLTRIADQLAAREAATSGSTVSACDNSGAQAPTCLRTNTGTQSCAAARGDGEEQRAVAHFCDTQAYSPHQAKRNGLETP